MYSTLTQTQTAAYSGTFASRAAASHRGPLAAPFGEGPSTGTLTVAAICESSCAEEGESQWLEGRRQRCTGQPYLMS